MSSLQSAIQMVTLGGASTAHAGSQTALLGMRPRPGSTRVGEFFVWLRGQKVQKNVVTVLKCSRINVLLVFLPLSVISQILKLNAKLQFAFSFLGMLPAAKIIGFLADEVSHGFPTGLGIFFRCTMGNLIELIAGILSITSCQLDLLQASLAGSVLVNILLVRGVVYLVSGFRFKETNYRVTANLNNCTLLFTSTVVTLMPTILAAAISGASPSELEAGSKSILIASRVISLFLLPLYTGFGFFQLKSHPYLFEGEDALEEDAEPSVNLVVAFGFGSAAIAILVIEGELLVGSLPQLISAQARPTTHWIGLILIPLVSTLARQDIFEAASNARKGRMELCVSMTTGASIHLVHFVLPVLVLLAWMLDKNLSLLLDPFQSITLFLSAIAVMFASMDGKGNYLLGMALLVLYTTLAISYWFYPGNNTYPGLKLSCS
ncbi:hypothetical protein C8R46DRAFT_1052681 [Mycena filopes]|nr:hypothetical protein C8R46DRAFT_1052681 [Mycena filopes]